MNNHNARALIDSANAHRSSYHQDNMTLDGLKANQADDGEAGERVRNHARKAEQTLLFDMKRLVDAVSWTNDQVYDAAVRHAKIEKARQAMELTDSALALHPAIRQAEAALVELTHLRTALLQTVISVASTLTPRDGRTSAADIATEPLFPGGPDLFAQPEPDAVAAVVEGVDHARRSAAQRSANLSDEEFAKLLGAF